MRPHNQLVTYNRQRWRVVRPGSYQGYDLATVRNGQTIVRDNIPSHKIHSVR